MLVKTDTCQIFQLTAANKNRRRKKQNKTKQRKLQDIKAYEINVTMPKIIILCCACIATLPDLLFIYKIVY
jgi:hypothetical protein